MFSFWGLCLFLFLFFPLSLDIVDSLGKRRVSLPWPRTQENFVYLQLENETLTSTNVTSGEEGGKGGGEGGKVFFSEKKISLGLFPL